MFACQVALGEMSLMTKDMEKYRQKVGHFKPHKKGVELLNWCLTKIKSISYKPTLRWVFYRCVQEHGLQKKDYKNFIALTSRARHYFWNGWRPNTLIDETKEISTLGEGFESIIDWLKAIQVTQLNLDKTLNQDKIAIVMYEARAMSGQFKHYAGPYYPNLIPCGGEVVISLNWQIAKLIESIDAKYHKPIKILYFGDYDTKGLAIPESSLQIRKSVV